MLKLLHVPEEIVRTVEQCEGLCRNDESDSFIITIPHQKACNINFNSDSEIHLLEPVKKAAKLSERPSCPHYSSADTSQQYNNSLNKNDQNTFRPKAFWSTRDDTYLSETEINLSQADELMLTNFISAESDKSLLSRVQCSSCASDECKTCEIVRNPLNSTLSTEFHKLWRNINSNSRIFIQDELVNYICTTEY